MKNTLYTLRLYLFTLLKASRFFSKVEIIYYVHVIITLFSQSLMFFFSLPLFKALRLQ